MRILYVTGIVVLLDQLSKIFIKGISIPALGIDIKGMLLGESIPIFGDVLQLTFIENPNMAFGIELGGKLFLSIFALIASTVLLAYLYRIREEKFLLRLALAFVLGGAFGNLFDRIFYGVLFGYGGFFDGNVVDFIDLNLFTINWGSFHFKFWPIFNIADSAVSLGVITLLLVYRPKHQTLEASDARSSVDPSDVASSTDAQPDQSTTVSST